MLTRIQDSTAVNVLTLLACGSRHRSGVTRVAVEQWHLMVTN